MRIPLVAALVAGCGGEPTCKELVDHVSKLDGKQMSDKQRDRAVSECESMKMSADTKKCVMKADSKAELVKCVPSDDELDRYEKKAKVSEAKIQLKKLEKNAKVAFNVNAEFPKGSAPLTPKESCCTNKDAKCRSTVDDWMKQPVWQSLDFQIDEPHLFQYSYESDGKTFTAKALGDLDCDTIFVTYELKGDVVNGTPQFTMTEPPAGAD